MKASKSVTLQRYAICIDTVNGKGIPGVSKCAVQGTTPRPHCKFSAWQSDCKGIDDCDMDVVHHEHRCREW
jgi:hypothetical protein